jgi:hypothetical protein
MLKLLESYSPKKFEENQEMKDRDTGGLGVGLTYNSVLVTALFDFYIYPVRLAKKAGP